MTEELLNRYCWLIEKGGNIGLNKDEQTEQIENRNKILAKMGVSDRLEMEINKTLYLMNTISPNIKCGQSTYDVYEEFLNKLKLIRDDKPETYYVSVTGPKLDVTIYSDATYTTHAKECTCDECAGKRK